MFGILRPRLGSSSWLFVLPRPPKLFGLTIDLDISRATLIALRGARLGFTMARKATAGSGKLQLFYETGCSQIQDLTDSVMGPAGASSCPSHWRCFSSSSSCNWIGVIPSGHNPEWLPPAPPRT